MALDHYISQVYLRNFCSPALGNRLHAIRKRDLKAFTPRAQDICRIDEGSTNRYFTSDRLIERFLEEIEPRYNSALAKFRADEIDEESIFTIAGFVAFVVGCTPTAMRLLVDPLQSFWRTQAEILERRGDLQHSPPELGGKTLTQLLDEHVVQVRIDTKFPQALGLNSILQTTSTFGNARWELLEIADDENVLFTSDFPAALERLSIHTPINRIVPLAPDLAVRIIPDFRVHGSQPDLRFSRFRYRCRRPNTNELMELNRLIVRSAEENVFFREMRPWISDFIQENRAFRIETATHRSPTDRGFLHIATQSIVEVPARKEASVGWVER